MPFTRSSSSALALCFVVVVILIGVAPRELSGGEAHGVPEEPAADVAMAADALIESVEDGSLRGLLREVAQRNPGVLVADARARAASLRAPQAKGLPDPVFNVIAYVEPPQTRTGPQRYVASLSQALPWRGRLKSSERAASLSAEAARAEADAMRLGLVTEARELYHEIAYLDRYRGVTEELRQHLLQHEELSRSRYATGSGLGQGIIKIQAEITSVDRDLLDIEARRIALVARLNGMRDRPVATPVTISLPDAVEEVTLDREALYSAAVRSRPEIAAATARISRAEALSETARKQDRPGFVVGLTYAGVDPRDDAVGRMQPPEGNGDDIFGIQGGLSIPIWRDKLGAGVEEALEMESAAASAKHDELVRIEAAIGDLAQRLPISWRQLRLIEDVMIVQAEEAVESARAGYVAGTLNALDLLDAEHVLFEARTAVARAEADYLVGIARLEGAVGVPLSEIPTQGVS